MRRIVLLAVIGLGLGLTGPSRADIGPPRPKTKQGRADLAPPLPQAKDVTVKIEVDEKAKGPRLVIPSGVFTALPVRPFPNPKGELPQNSEDGIAENDSETPQPRQHLMIAGVAVALSLAFGGMWLVRRNGAGSIRGLALLIAAGATLAVGAVVWANVPPPTFKGPVRKVESYPVALESKAGVEFVYGQEPVRLILDKESYEKLKKGELQAPSPKPVPK